MSKKFIASLLIAIISFGGFAQVEKLKTKNVIVLIMDGPRFSETWGDSTHQYIPHMANDMAQHGIIFDDFRNNGPTYTSAGHAAICTGIYQKIKNNGKELPKNPSMFQYWLKATSSHKKKAYIITSKDKLSVLTNCKDKKWNGQFRPAQSCGNDGLFSGYRSDLVTYQETIQILEKDQPNLVLVNFQQPDSWGHANNWEEYLKGITKSDEYIFRIFEFIQKNQHYKGTTTLFVTNDHGRHPNGHKDGFVSHGDNCEGCRKINFFAYGPDFKRNVIMSAGREQIDIPVTIAYMMGFEIPCSKGEVMTELFQSK